MTLIREMSDEVMRGEPMIEVFILGEEAWKRLGDEIQPFLFKRGDVGIESARMGFFMGMPIVLAPRAPPHRVELHYRDFSGQPMIKVIR